MRTELSILLPTYECSCAHLVAQLHEQCSRAGIRFEILVADDGSENRQFVEQDKEQLRMLPNAHYMARTFNVGRAAIRNFLARESRFCWLLFIDGDISLNNPHLIENYLSAEGEVVVGGLSIGGDKRAWKHNLRYRYEKDAEKKHSAQKRQQQQHQEFRTTNFLIRRDIVIRHPFNEKFRLYGYEDVDFGRQLSENHIDIRHIDNPVLLSDYEPNHVFIEKTEESLHTLCEHEQMLRGYSNLLRTADNIEKRKLTGMVKLSYKWLAKPIKHNLKGNNPILFLFNIYKMLYFIHIKET